MANTGRIDHAQTSVPFLTPLLDAKRLPCLVLKRAIRLERKVGSGEAPCFPRRVALVGGPYPAVGGDEGGRAAACSFCGGMAAANSVVRTGAGSISRPTSSRKFHTHLQVEDKLCRFRKETLPLFAV